MKKNKYIIAICIIIVVAVTTILTDSILSYKDVPIYKVKEDMGDIVELITPEGIKYVKEPKILWGIIGKCEDYKGWNSRIGITDFSNDVGVFKFEGDENITHLTVRNENIKLRPSNILYRTDIDYDYILHNEIDKISFTRNYYKAENRVTITNKTEIEKIKELVLNEDKYVYINTQSNLDNRVGWVLFYSNKLPGLYYTKPICEYKGELYYDSGKGTDFSLMHCIKDTGTIKLPPAEETLE